jgi:Zn-dependent metalloprotease
MTHRCSIVPPYLLQHLADHAPEPVAASARETLALDLAVRQVRDVRQTSPGSGGVTGGLRDGAGPDVASGPSLLPPGRTLRERAVAPPGPAVRDRQVHDAEQGTVLPGRLVRGEDDPAGADESVDEAHHGLGATWDLLHEAFGRSSLDGAGLPLVASVHYGHRFDNAFWDGRQMVFGDGDGEVFRSFTDSVDVIGHELGHGVVQHTLGLVYLGQAGALNESVCDVLGSLVKQRLRGQDAADADWLVGAELFTDQVQGAALRSLKAPGTAYDDDVLGKDPQPATMAGYVELPHDAEHDNGGVHVNSGIPNHAFYLAATAIGGRAWERAGLVWYDALTSSGLPRDAGFAAFARATVEASTKRFGAGSAEVASVAGAWEQVGLRVDG